MIQDNYAWAGKTAILYNVDLTDTSSATDFGFKYRPVSNGGGNNSQSFVTVSIKNNDPDWNVALDNKTTANIYVENNTVGLLGTYDAATSPYLVVVKNLIPGTTYEFQSYKVVNGTESTYDSTTKDTLPNIATFNVDTSEVSGWESEEDGNIYGHPEEILDNINHAIEVIDEMANVEGDLKLQTPKMFEQYHGVTWLPYDSGSSWSGSIIVGGLSSAVTNSSAHLATLIARSLMSTKSDPSSVKKFMEWATGREDAIWRWKDLFNSPTFGPNHSKRHYENYNSSTRKYDGSFHGSDADLYRIAAALEVSRRGLTTAYYYLYGVSGASGSNEYNKRYYAQFKDNKYIFKIPYYHNSTFYSNIPYSVDESAHPLVTITQDNTENHYSIYEPTDEIVVGGWTQNGYRFQVLLDESDDSYDQGYEGVDLGLPSGLIWGSSNVISSNTYFAWGETQGYNGPNESKPFSWYYNDYAFGKNGEWTKYNTSDNKTILDSENDAARVHMGGMWRMPVKAELDELLAHTNQSSATINGVSGYKFTNKTNSSKFIFVPIAQTIEGGSFTSSRNLLIRSSQIVDPRSEAVYALRHSNGTLQVGTYDARYVGMTIWPVYSKSNYLYRFISECVANGGGVGNLSLTDKEKAYIKTMCYIDDNPAINDDTLDTILDYNNWKVTLNTIDSVIDEELYNEYNHSTVYKNWFSNLTGEEADASSLKMFTLSLDISAGLTSGVRYSFILDDKGRIVKQKQLIVPPTRVNVYYDNNQANLYSKAVCRYDVATDTYVYRINLSGAESRDFRANFPLEVQSKRESIEYSGENDVYWAGHPTKNYYEFKMQVKPLSPGDEVYVIHKSATVAAPIKIIFFIPEDGE